MGYFQGKSSLNNLECNYSTFGMVMPGRSCSNGDYRYGFNGMEKDDEVKGVGNSLDFGARVYDTRLGRWLSIDAMASHYPGYSPYNFALNTPISAIDPDGNLVLFIGGLRLWQGIGDQRMPSTGERGSFQRGFYKHEGYDGPLRGYWNGNNEENTFGRKVDIANYFMTEIGDDNAYYSSGSSRWTSQASDRYAEGKVKAQEFHAAFKRGEIELADDETIKIVSHSQGGAHAAGFAEELMSYKDADGNSLYNVEVIYYITPHQPTDITTPEGIRSVQYSHPNDAVSGDGAAWWLPNGGTEHGQINGVDEFYSGDIMGGEGQPEFGGSAGNRNGHNVTDNDEFIQQSGSVQPRKDK